MWLFMKFTLKLNSGAKPDISMTSFGTKTDIVKSFRYWIMIVHRLIWFSLYWSFFHLLIWFINFSMFSRPLKVFKTSMVQVPFSSNLIVSNWTKAFMWLKYCSWLALVGYVFWEEMKLDMSFYEMKHCMNENGFIIS